jgi:membrane protein required for colicin V production
MAWIDIVFIIILLILGFHGLLIGLIRSICDIIGILMAYILAVSFSPLLEIPRVLSFFLIFIIVVIAVHLIGRILSKAIKATPLNMLDRLLGGLLGFVKGLIICFVVLLIMLLLKRPNNTVERSTVAPWILKGGLTASQVLPGKWSEWIEHIIAHRSLAQDHEDHHFSL